MRIGTKLSGGAFFIQGLMVFTIPPNEPCPICDCPVLYVDPERRVRCLQCDPPPNPIFIRVKIDVLVDEDGGTEWVSRGGDISDLVPRRFKTAVFDDGVVYYRDDQPAPRSSDLWEG